MLVDLTVYVLVFTGILGSGVAGYFDLKTTEIPDKIPLIMGAIGILLRFSYSLLTGDWNFIVAPVLVSLGFLGFGLLMYYTGQWGGGDAKVLGAMGLLIGVLPESFLKYSIFPFWADYFFNIFLVGVFYTIIYAFGMVFRNPKISRGFLKDFKGSLKELSLFILLGFGFIIFASFFTNLYSLSISIGVLIIGLFVLFKFLKAVEEIGFKKKIKTKNLKEGDMLNEPIPELDLNSKIIKGLTKEEVKSIKKAKKTVCIREGVRFGPVFCIALLVTLFWGNLITFLVI